MPKEMSRSDFIKSISCGAHHTMLITQMRRVYGFGFNLNGQLALTGTADGEVVQINQPTFSESLSSKEIV